MKVYQITGGPLYSHIIENNVEKGRIMSSRVVCDGRGLAVEFYGTDHREQAKKYIEKLERKE